MTLLELARTHGKGLSAIGLPPGTAYCVSAGIVKASPRTIDRVAQALSVPAPTVAAACDASWSAKHPPAPPVGPVANGQPAPQPET
jgi:hypothetical protein